MLRCRYSTGVASRLPEPAVDPGDEELDLVALGAVLRALEPRRDEHLQHRRRLRALRILLEEALERLQLLRDPLRVVEPLDARGRAGAPRSARRARRRAAPSPDRASVSRKPATSMPIGSTPIPTSRPLDVDPVRLGVEAEHAQARRAEVARVVARAGSRCSRRRAHRGAPASRAGAGGRPPTTGTGCGGRSRSRGRAAVRGASPGRASGGSRAPRPACPGPALLDDRVGEALVHLDVALPRLRRDANRSAK